MFFDHFSVKIDFLELELLQVCFILFRLHIIFVTFLSKTDKVQKKS